MYLSVRMPLRISARRSRAVVATSLPLSVQPKLAATNLAAKPHELQSAADKALTPAAPGRGGRARGRTLRRLSNPWASIAAIVGCVLALVIAALPVAPDVARAATVPQ